MPQAASVEVVRDPRRKASPADPRVEDVRAKEHDLSCTESVMCSAKTPRVCMTQVSLRLPAPARCGLPKVRA